MPFCSNCGREVVEKAVICPNCGVPVQGAVNAVDNDGGFVWGLLGFMVPIVGWILGSTWKETRPKAAQTASRWAWISFALWAFFVVIYLVLIAIGAALS